EGSELCVRRRQAGSAGAGGEAPAEDGTAEYAAHPGQGARARRRPRPPRRQSEGPVASEGLADGEGCSLVERLRRRPPYAEPGVELELVDDQGVDAQTDRVRARELVLVGDAVDRAVADGVVEDAELEHVAQQRVPELELQPAVAARVLVPERAAQNVAADRRLLGKEDESGARHAVHLDPQLVPAEGKHLLVPAADVKGALLSGVRRPVDARIDAKPVVTIAADVVRVERQLQRRFGVLPRVRDVIR